jgi:phosphoserine phosphatase
MFIATLVAKGRLGEGDISAARDAIGGGEVRWLEAGRAIDLRFEADPAVVRAKLEAVPGEIDIIVQPEAHRRRKLLIADMDSTMITVECIDELADYAGIKAEIAAVTEAAMRGELDFEGALRGRVGLLRGLEEAAIDRCLAERVEIMPGARELVRTFRALGGLTILVSGGFTRFAEPVAEQIGFERVRANRLSIAGGMLTGTVEGHIVGAQTKRETLLAALSEKGWGPEAAVAIGDGANDIPMIEAAGLGVAYHAKPKTIAAADAAIRHGDLTVLLYAMGIPKSEWVV